MMAKNAADIRLARPMSPCISVCALDHSGHCAGCLRTREEIASWIRLSADQQWDLLRTLERRRAERAPRRSV
ncbi:MAG: DUF1289 domain-containing protein [Gammaproteobacteria bacterium]|nr:DUF1289 domain-containing protein [Gammaproteobacteria bacterium]